MTEDDQDPASQDLASTALALARRFAAGATLWCVAPHAHHLAAEFVHPMTAGQPGLPAFALTGSDLVRRARAAVRPGDILVAIAGGQDAAIADLMRRAPAWGALSVWIGSGPRPAAGAADHVLWADDDQLAPLSRRLWQLTHARREQPPAQERTAAQERTEETCITCSDEGRLAEVIEPSADVFDRALVRTGTGLEAIDVTLVAPVSAGDLVLVHAGAALTKLNEERR